MNALPFWREIFWVTLLPVSLFWSALTWARRRFYPPARRYRATVPVLCVGNLHSGGSGKTPLVEAIARHFSDRNPIILSRGYRGSLSGAGGQVDRTREDGAALYGDEPWMLAKLLTNEIHVGKDRARKIRELERHGRPIILDDGFQHLRVLPHCALVLINTAQRYEDSYCLPLGDLREPLSALAAAQAVVLVSGADSRGVDEWKSVLGGAHPRLPIFEAKRIPRGLWDGEKIVPLSREKPVSAFCAIARPEGFFSDLSHFASLARKSAFPDHYAYRPSDLEQLNHKKVGTLVTTDKDWFKVKSWFEERGTALLRLRIEYEISSDFWYFLQNHWAS